MEYHKIINLLDATSKFITKRWTEVHDQCHNTDDMYKPSKQIRFKTSMLQADLCDYSDANLVVKGTINVRDPNNKAYDKKLAFKNNAAGLDIVMSMFKLFEYSKNYSKTNGSLWNY